MRRNRADASGSATTISWWITGVGVPGMDAGGGAGRAAAVVVGDGAGGDGVWHARERAAMNAAAIRVRVIADFQDRGLTGLLALTGGTEHVFVIVLTPLFCET